MTSVGFHFHRWAKWEQYTYVGTIRGPRWLIDGGSLSKGAPITEIRQKRNCVICNKQQDELVRAQ